MSVTPLINKHWVHYWPFFGLCSTIKFPTRIQKNSHSSIDNIFINTFKFNNFSIFLIINGLSDRDAHSITLHKVLESSNNSYFYFNRQIDKYTILDFNTKLSHETWEVIFTENDINTSFDKLFNTYIRLFHSSFPFKKVYYKSCNKTWLTAGIEISCINKRKLHIIQRSCKDRTVTDYYRKYCGIVTNVIKLAKLYCSMFS
jgi:hypothetical protein